MATIKDLDFAIDETKKKYPENQFSLVLSRIINEQEGAYRYITSTNNARKIVASIPKNEIIAIIAKEIVSIFNYCTIIENTDREITNAHGMAERFRLLNTKCPYYSEVKNMILEMRQKNVNTILYFLSNNTRLLEALYIVEEYHYNLGVQYRELLARYGDGNQLPSKCDISLKNKIESDYERSAVVRNVQVNAHAVNQCIADIVSGAQIRNMNNEYAVGKDLYASQNVGRRGNQEDSVLIMNHPRNENFKLLVVSDGMGGCADGEKVSNFTVREIGRWFENIDESLYDKPEVLQTLFNDMINRISQEMKRVYNRERFTAGATFTGAIITKNETIVSQVGDSRAYIFTNGTMFKKPQVTPITRDDTRTWPWNPNTAKPLDPRKIPQEQYEDIRFARGGNAIARCIGDDIDANVQSSRFPNESYDKLFLMSDGASDLLDLEGIKIICKNTPWEDITKLLVQAAITKKAIRGRSWNEFYTKLARGTLSAEEINRFNQLHGYEDETHMGEIQAAKDNTTVAGYFRR